MPAAPIRHHQYTLQNMPSHSLSDYRLTGQSVSRPSQCYMQTDIQSTDSDYTRLQDGPESWQTVYTDVVFFCAAQY